MFGKPGSATGDEISVTGLVVGLVALVAGAGIMGLIPLLRSFSRIGYAGTGLMVLAMVALAIAFFPAYERFKPSSPPAPRRDFLIILFAALLIGLWASEFTNEVVAIVVLGACGAVVLVPDDQWQRLTDRLPWS